MDRTRIYRELFNRVVRGRLPRGEWLREDALAAEFGVSRTPVREALFLLAQDGLAEAIPRRGFRSLGFSVDDLEEAYEIRHVLELLALERAVGTLPIVELQSIRARMQSLRDVDDPLAHAAVDAELHTVIINSSQSPRLIGLLSNLSRIMSTFRELSFEDEEIRHHAADEHERLVDALAAREGSAGAAILDDHIRVSKSRVMVQVLGTSRGEADAGGL